MAKPHLLSKRIGENYLRRVFLHPPNHRQIANEQTIGKAAPTLKEQANYVACLDQIEQKNNDAISDCGKAKVREAKVLIRS